MLVETALARPVGASTLLTETIGVIAPVKMMLMASGGAWAWLTTVRARMVLSDTVELILVVDMAEFLPKLRVPVASAVLRL
ncbi:MAG: hypothetical protein NTY19_05300 [Planctomycetota bacterium]|nr:hypothetical protein [Planctomycetota bacterium]